jgi:hypothetical protein
MGRLKSFTIPSCVPTARVLESGEMASAQTLPASGARTFVVGGRASKWRPRSKRHLGHKPSGRLAGSTVPQRAQEIG